MASSPKILEPSLTPKRSSAVEQASVVPAWSELPQLLVHASLLRGAALAAPARDLAGREVRRAMGLNGEPVAPCVDPDLAYLQPGGPARKLHSDLPAMIIGGVASLLLQSLHPLAMAGVADHSNYREDPLGRLERTARYVGTVTFSSTEEAAAAIARVRKVHVHVRGTAPDGRHYSALDPDLITWVHVSEVAMFASAASAFGRSNFSPQDLDAYVAELVPQALALGATSVPATMDELTSYFAAIRPELHLGAQAKDVRSFLLAGVAKRPLDRLAYGVVVAAAISVLPSWARRMLQLPLVPLTRPLLIRPAAQTFAKTVRLALPIPEGI